jgi:hypothetical protein
LLDCHGRRRVTLIGLALTVVCSVIGLIAGILATTGASPSSAAIPLLWVGQAIGGTNSAGQPATAAEAPVRNGPAPRLVTDEEYEA